MSRTWAWAMGSAAAGCGFAVAGYLGLVTAAVPVDLSVGRRRIPLGLRTTDVDAPARPYSTCLPPRT